MSGRHARSMMRTRHTRQERGTCVSRTASWLSKPTRKTTKVPPIRQVVCIPPAKAIFFTAASKFARSCHAGKGTWPAIWMLPSDPFRYSTSCEEGDDWQGSSTCDAWPNSGEIDIMEHVGYEMGHIHGTVHNEAYYWLKWEQRKGRILLAMSIRIFTSTRCNGRLTESIHSSMAHTTLPTSTKKPAGVHGPTTTRSILF